MLFLSLLLLLTTVVQAFYPAGTKVQELSTATFDTTVYQTKKPVFVKFYSPGCCHCRNAAPIWDAVSHNLDVHVLVASVNCQVENALCGRFQISGVPAFKLFTQNDDNQRIVLDYQGAREVNPIIAYADLHMPSYLWRLTDDPVPEGSPVIKRLIGFEAFLEKGSRSGHLPHAIIFRPAGRGREVKMGLRSLSVAFYGKIVIGIALVGTNPSNAGGEKFEALYKTKGLVERYHPPLEKDSMVFLPSGDAQPVWFEKKFAFTPLMEFLKEQLSTLKPKDEL